VRLPDYKNRYDNDQTESNKSRLLTRLPFFDFVGKISAYIRKRYLLMRPRASSLLRTKPSAAGRSKDDGDFRNHKIAVCARDRLMQKPNLFLPASTEWLLLRDSALESHVYSNRAQRLFASSPLSKPQALRCIWDVQFLLALHVSSLSKFVFIGGNVRTTNRTSA
jgi:hypothetical protein